MNKLHSMFLVRARKICKACGRAPSFAQVLPWLKAGLFLSRTLPGRGTLRIDIASGKNKAVFLDASSREEMDVFAEVLVDQNYPLNRVPFHPSLVLDLGANIGFFGAAARSAFPDTPIRGWEPDSRNYCRAVAQPILADEKTEITQAAVSDRDGAVRITGSGHGCAITQQKEDGDEVPCVDFPGWWRAHGKPGAVFKIDIEGHEEKLLPAMQGLWLPPCALFLETHAERGSDDGIVALLRADGFHVELLRSHALPGDSRVFKEYFALLSDVPDPKL